MHYLEILLVTVDIYGCYSEGTDLISGLELAVENWHYTAKSKCYMFVSYRYWLYVTVVSTEGTQSHNI